MSGDVKTVVYTNRTLVQIVAKSNDSNLVKMNYF